jgi:hypothetical protein
MAFAGLIFMTFGALFGCAAPSQSRVPDPSRSTSPVPACILRLPPRGVATGGTMRQLDERGYWRLVYSEDDQSSESVPREALACNGRPAFDGEAFNGARPVGGGAIAIREGAILYGGGANRLRILWFQTHELPDGRTAGPLALVRTLEDYAEAYAIGSYAGSKDKTRLGLERMGADIVVTAVNDGCNGAPPGQDCDSTLHVYFPFRGELVELAAIGLERVRTAVGTEPGVAGAVEYKLVTSPTYEKGGIKLLEQVSTTAEDGRKLRRAELQRFLKRIDGRVAASDKSLWDRMYAKAPASDAAGSGASPAEPNSPDSSD